jgi:geranylgeranyl diphosphate synthase type II
LSQHREVVEEIIHENLSKIQQERLRGAMSHLFTGGGKRLRAIMPRLVGEAVGNGHQGHYTLGACIEIIHNFTLVHDDIMDQDSIRHGQKTVHNKWDDGVAILTGDAMLSLALRLLNKTPVESHLQMKIFIEGLLAVCEGQALDKEFENQSSVSLDDYIKMIDLKTGYLIGLAAELGAVSTGMDSGICEKVRDYGRLIGRAFQIQDDYLEIFSNSLNMGKSLESDIVLGKKTFLMIQALEKDTDIIKLSLELARNDFGKGIANIRSYLENEGIKKRAQEEINNILKLADNKLNDLPIDKEKLLYFSKIIKKRGN